MSFHVLAVHCVRVCVCVYCTCRLRQTHVYELVLSPGHSQLFIVSHEKREGLGVNITCVTPLTRHKTYKNRSMGAGMLWLLFTLTLSLRWCPDRRQVALGTPSRSRNFVLALFWRHISLKLLVFEKHEWSDVRCSTLHCTSAVLPESSASDCQSKVSKVP